ncbi:MAG: hypothetical protein M1119_12210 [Firmicutes bacterium]|nr:hypothetical protein [Bacillota bacterium]
MRLKLLGNILGLVLVALLITVPLGQMFWQQVMPPSDPHAGHDMSTMNQSDMSSANQADPNAGHDMNNMNQAEGDASEQHANSGDSAGHGSGNSNSHDSGNINTPPNWPVIYGFGAFNLLVIIAAALLKNRGIQRNEVN